jgi:hypothetical protein
MLLHRFSQSEKDSILIKNTLSKKVMPGEKGTWLSSMLGT